MPSPLPGETLASIRSQEWADLEHIVVDGGSTDDTLEMLRNEPTVRVETGADAGLYDAINRGVAVGVGRRRGVPKCGRRSRARCARSGRSRVRRSSRCADGGRRRQRSFADRLGDRDARPRQRQGRQGRSGSRTSSTARRSSTPLLPPRAARARGALRHSLASVRGLRLPHAGVAGEPRARCRRPGRLPVTRHTPSRSRSAEGSRSSSPRSSSRCAPQGSRRPGRRRPCIGDIGAGTAGRRPTSPGGRSSPGSTSKRPGAWATG